MGNQVQLGRKGLYSWGLSWEALSCKLLSAPFTNAGRMLHVLPPDRGAWGVKVCVGIKVCFFIAFVESLVLNALWSLGVCRIICLGNMTRQTSLLVLTVLMLRAQLWGSTGAIVAPSCAYASLCVLVFINKPRVRNAARPISTILLWVCPV